jgi:hypothetical protein
MAYGAVKFTEFTDNCDIDWKIQIYQKDHTGTNTSFTTGPTGFDLKYKGERFDDKMKSSEITFSFFSTSSSDDTFLTNLSTDLPSTYIVEVFRDTAGTNSTYWKGIIQTSNFQIKDTFYPQEYKLRAICGLQLLKSQTTVGLTNLIKGGYSEKYTLDTSDVQTITLGSIIASCLSTLPSSELWTTSETFVRRRGCWNGTGMDSYPNDTFHEFGYLSSNLYDETQNGNFEFRKQFDTVEEILNLMNARLYQEDGIWRLEQLGIFNDINTLSTPPRYYRIAKDSDQLGSGNGNAVTTDLTATNSQFIKSAGMLTGFSEVIRRIETSIEDVAEFEQDYIQQTPLAISADSTPIAADFINTNLTRSNTGQFVVLNYSFLAQNISATLTNAPSTTYTIGVNAFIKVGSNYLQMDTDVSSSTYNQMIWSSGVNPVISEAAFINGGLGGADITVTGIESGSEQINAVFFQPFNPPTTNTQYQIPSDDNIEVYFYYRVFSTPFSPGITSDVTSSFTSSNFAVSLSPSYPQNYGFKVMIVDENGAYAKLSKFTSTNSPSGTEIEGGIFIEDEVRFENSTALTSAPSIFMKNSSGSWVNNIYDFQNVLQSGGIDNDLTRLRQKEKIAMQAKSLDLIRGTLLKRDLRQLGLTNDTTTLVLHKPIFIGTKLYLIVGFNFSAVTGSYEVTLQELNYDFVAAGTGSDLFALVMEFLTEDWTGQPTGPFNF